MNGDNNDAQDLKNTAKDDAKDLKNAYNSDYKEMKCADNGDSKDLLNAAANYDGKLHIQNDDKNDEKDLNDGKVHPQNADKNNDKDLNDGKSHLQDADKNDGQDQLQNHDSKDPLQSADKDLDDGTDQLQNIDLNDGNNLADYSDDDQDMHYAAGYGAYADFEWAYHCYSMSNIDKAHLENGDKVLLPPSALEQLAYLEIEFPLLFELNNLSSGKVTHCGVQEFTADEGNVFLPAWMMEGMLNKEGDTVVVKYTSLPKGTYVKLQPHTMAFLDISNPKAVLERVLRSYSCLTTGGTIVFSYNDKKYYVDIVETKPSAAVCIIETDCEVEFAPPLDYKEPDKPVKPRPEVDEEPTEKKLKVGPFSGSGRRLDGKPSTQLVSSPVLKQHQPNNGSGTTTAKQQSGTLVFGSSANDSLKRNLKEKAQDSAHEEDERKFIAFTGKKYLLNDSAS